MIATDPRRQPASLYIRFDNEIPPQARSIVNIIGLHCSARQCGDSCAGTVHPTKMTQFSPRSLHEKCDSMQLSTFSPNATRCTAVAISPRYSRLLMRIASAIAQEAVRPSRHLSSYTMRTCAPPSISFNNRTCDSVGTQSENLEVVLFAPMYTVCVCLSYMFARRRDLLYTCARARVSRARVSRARVYISTQIVQVQRRRTE